MSFLLAVLAGLVLGFFLGALGGGGSILAVPVLAYLLGQPPLQATTGALVIVGVSASMGAVSAHRDGRVKLVRGTVFGVVGVIGAAVGSSLSTRVNPDLLMAVFALLVLVVAGVMIWRQRHPLVRADDVDAPLFQIHPRFQVDAPRLGKVVVAGLVVGLLTGFLGVGGGFLVVPALVLALGLQMADAVGTSLLVIAFNSAAAFVVRMLHGVDLDWPILIQLTGVAMMGSLVGSRVASRYDQKKLTRGFIALLVVVALYTAARSWPAVLG